MKIGVYFCNCGTNIKDKIDSEKVKMRMPSDIYFETVDFACSEDGKKQIEESLVKNGIQRMVISACSPRDHERTFMKVMENAGLNPYLMQMVNVREQVAWVTDNMQMATEKASRYINAAIKRVALQSPLQKKEMEICKDAVIIGAGPAGLKSALSLAEAGRKAVIVEKSPVIGGMPVRYEELFPNMECGPCMLEPLMGEILHGEYSDNIELLTLSEVVDVVGFYGNFTVTIRQRPRYVDIHKCIGCGECIESCPATTKNEFNYGLNERKAISFPFAGALPNAPFIDDSLCLRTKGEDCTLCKNACPVEDAILFDDKESILQRSAGAIVIAIGSDIYDCRNIPNLGYGTIDDVYTSVEFERIVASNGPTDGEIRMLSGQSPRTIAIVHCVGSLDKNHKEYCSGICCQEAFKLNHIIHKKLPEAKIYHFYKELVVPGKDEFSLYHHARGNPNSVFVRYEDIADFRIADEDGRKTINLKGNNIEADMVILCPAVVPSSGAGRLGAILEASNDKFGFFEELHNRMDSVQSRMRGIYLAGTCQSPMDIQKAMNQGMAAAGYILSGLAVGKKLEISPIIAVVDADRCSGCRVCISVCPYKAISFDAVKEVSVVNEVLCQGCGTCVSACPCSAITGNHFTNEEIFAEIEEVLQ